MSARLERDEFAAMGTQCSVAVTRGPDDGASARLALAAGRAEVEACEQELSRFRPTSDLSRLNRNAGEWVPAGRRLIGALRAVLRAREQTAGRFDPTILPALVAAGYDRSFEQLEARPARRADGWRAAAAVEIDEESSRARVESGAAVDLGGIGKGFSATRTLEAMRAVWPSLPGGLVDLGGDIAVWGATPEGGPWRVAIADPRRPGETLATLRLVEGGIATSGRDRRRFGLARELHHLIDPATGAPAGAGPLTVTVVAPSAAEAEAHATALAISTLDEARAHLSDKPHMSALYVPEAGRAVAIGQLPLAPTFRLAVGA